MNTICFHCGDIVPSGAHYPIHYQGQEYPACCAGCQAVARTIIDGGLGQYYAQRDHFANRNDPLPSDILEQISLYDSPSLQQGFVHTESANIREGVLLLEGISCAACIWLNEQHIARLPGVLSASINYTTHRARVRWDESRIHLSEILKAVAAIGYRAQPYNQVEEEASWQKRRKTALFRLWVAGLSMMQVMMFAIPSYLATAGEIEVRWQRLMNWSSLLLTLPVVVYSCWPFFQTSWRELRLGRTGMDLPVSIGVLAAFSASCWTTITGHGDVYFDSISMFVFLLLLGRFWEESARRKAGDATERLVKLIPAFAHRLDEDGATHEAPVISLVPGVRILVKPGETIPIDGTIENGTSEVSEALITGESRGLQRKTGESVTGGSINLASPIIIRVEKVGESTHLAAIVRLLDRALTEKPRLTQLVDRIASRFVTALLFFAGMTWLAWHSIDPARALPITVAVLVISCPCALSLATPSALTAATGRLARLGLMVTRSHALEALANITDVVFDKTGTLTQGKPRIESVESLSIPEAQARQIAAALEASSSHPLAHAFALEGISAASGCAMYPGNGISGWIDNTEYAIGHPAFIATFCTAPAPSEINDQVLALASRQQWLATFTLADSIRPGAQQCITELEQLGIAPQLLSGDQNANVAALATQLGLSTFRSDATPDAKLTHLHHLQQNGQLALMVGDGVNDAPVLAAASVSIAMGGGVDVAHAAGDMVLLGNRLETIPAAVRIARFTRHITRQNLAWALIYNLIAIPLAISGLVTPWLASLGMACSSLLVVLNALRIARIKDDQWKASIY
ncbi:MAG: heavy metal translocating P-type ATPase [Formivibrio sp.]|nr:heavy metal translocating P-type ATPase [Formivibrio sp.]